MADTIDENGEIIPDREDRSREVDISSMVGLARAEIDMQIATARRYPRIVSTVIKKITELATLDPETAEECCYALVRKKKGKRAQDEENKPIEGPSIRLAEIAAQSYGNCRIDSRTIAVNRKEMYVEAEGIFHDLETNMASRDTVRRPIKTSGGFLFSDDMINVTSNAARAIAKRNAILAGIPKGITRPGYKAARAIMAGTLQTLGENRSKVYKAFASHGITPDQIHELLDVGGEADIGLDHIALLRATFSSIKNGEATVNEVFGKEKPQGVVDPLGSGEPKGAKVEAADKMKVAGDENKKADGEKTASKKEPAAVTTSAEAPAGVGVSAGQDKAGEAGVASNASPAEETKPAEATEKVAGGQEQTTTQSPGQTEQAKPATETAAAKPPANEAEYRSYVLHYVGEATSASALESAWKDRAERKLRQDVNITTEVHDELLAAVKARVAKLKEGAQ